MASKVQYIPPPAWGGPAETLAYSPLEIGVAPDPSSASVKRHRRGLWCCRIAICGLAFCGIALFTPILAGNSEASRLVDPNRKQHVYHTGVAVAYSGIPRPPPVPPLLPPPYNPPILPPRSPPLPSAPPSPSYPPPRPHNPPSPFVPPPPPPPSPSPPCLDGTFWFGDSEATGFTCSDVRQNSNVTCESQHRLFGVGVLPTMACCVCNGESTYTFTPPPNFPSPVSPPSAPPSPETPPRPSPAPPPPMEPCTMFCFRSPSFESAHEWCHAELWQVGWKGPLPSFTPEMCSTLTLHPSPPQLPVDASPPPNNVNQHTHVSHSTTSRILDALETIPQRHTTPYELEGAHTGTELELVGTLQNSLSTLPQLPPFVSSPNSPPNPMLLFDQSPHSPVIPPYVRRRTFDSETGYDVGLNDNGIALFLDDSLHLVEIEDPSSFFLSIYSDIRMLEEATSMPYDMPPPDSPPTLMPPPNTPPGPPPRPPPPSPPPPLLPPSYPPPPCPSPAPPPPTNPPPMSPPWTPGTKFTCTDECATFARKGNSFLVIDLASDGQCDDGGPGAEFNFCALTTDCSDCGIRVTPGPWTPPDPPITPYPPGAPTPVPIPSSSS